MFIVLDLETISNESIPYAGESHDGLLAAPHHRIVVFGMLKIAAGKSSNFMPLKLELLDESSGLRDFASSFHRNDRLITFGGRSFDIPIACARALHYGVQLGRYYGGREGAYGDPRNRYDLAHVDLMEQFSEYGAAKRSQLDACAKLIGFPGKLGISGRDVAGLVESGDIERVRTYCAEDLFTTAALYLKLRYVSGLISPVAFAAAYEHIRAYAANEPRLSRLEGLVDWKIFQCVEPESFVQE